MRIVILVVVALASVGCFPKKRAEAEERPADTATTARAESPRREAPPRAEPTKPTRPTMVVTAAEVFDRVRNQSCSCRVGTYQVAGP
jgi:hypothetical protein